jgi:hypothetical protein
LTACMTYPFDEREKLLYLNEQIMKRTSDSENRNDK